MKIHEFQSKELLSRHRVLVPPGAVAADMAVVRQIIARADTFPLVVKAQVLAGGRGQGGGVRVCANREQALAAAADILGMRLVTAQTGAEGQLVNRILLEQGVAIEQEFYLSLLVDRATATITFLASAVGGMALEELAASRPEMLVRVAVDPLAGLQGFHLRQLAFGLELPPELHREFGALCRNLYHCFTSLDCLLLEINPLGLTSRESGQALAGQVLGRGTGVGAAKPGSGPRSGATEEDSGPAPRFVALDAKLEFDDNALFRHPELPELRDPDEESEPERRAREAGLNYIGLNGNIASMVNGAGLAMATMDLIKQAGGEPANFLDVGGGASAEMVAEGLRIILQDPRVEAVLINIFGGILRCDLLAQGVVEAARRPAVQVPLIVRLEGTNVEQGRQILNDAGLDLTFAADLGEVSRAVAALTAGKQDAGAANKQEAMTGQAAGNPVASPTSPASPVAGAVNRHRERRP